jgi:hypothetical protein
VKGERGNPLMGTISYIIEIFFLKQVYFEIVYEEAKIPHGNLSQNTSKGNE